MSRHFLSLDNQNEPIYFKNIGSHLDKLDSGKWAKTDAKIVVKAPSAQQL